MDWPPPGSSHLPPTDPQTPAQPVLADAVGSRCGDRGGRMSLQVTRLHLATMLEEWPVHGYLVTYPGGAVLVDTGVGGPQQVLTDHRVVNRSATILGLRRCTARGTRRT